MGETQQVLPVKNQKSGKRPALEVVCEHLRRAILSGELAQGAPLRQDALADQFGISRIPVREALRQLAHEGWVQIAPNRGATVTSLSLDEVLEMLDIRIALECHALRLAIPHMVEEDFAVAQEALQSYGGEDEPERWAQMNWRFHRALYAPCQRPRLLQLIEENHRHIHRFVLRQVSRASGRERPQKEHYRLLALCREQATEEAVRLLSAHIEQTQKNVQASQRHRMEL